MAKSPPLEVTITYKWTFTEKEWKESIEHWEKYHKEMGLKIEYDPLSMFHSMSNLGKPEYVAHTIKKLDAKLV